jgi:PAS domain S-box-containing protein
MFGLRSARSRAIATGTLFLLLLAGVATTAADRAADTALWPLIGLSAAAFALAAATVAGAIVSTVRPLATLRASARAITAGGPGVRADVSGPQEAASLARDFNAMTDALAAKAQEYIDTTNLTGVIILRVDKDNRVSLVNDAMCEFLGRSREEILGTPILDYLHPDDALSTIRAIRKMVQSKGLVTGIVSRYVTPMGTRVTEWNGYPIFDEQGRYAGVHGTGRDISECKRAEEALRETRDYLEKLIDYANAPIIVWDPSFNITRFNRAFERLTGRLADEVIGQRLGVLFPEKERAASMEQIDRTLRGEFWELIEIPILHQSGQVLQVLWNSANIMGADGRTVVATIAQGTDITERKRAEEALRESRERYRLLAENVTDVIWTMDTDLRFTYVSPSVTRLRGYTVEEAMGQTVKQVLTPASLEVVKKVIAAEQAIEQMEQKDLARSLTLELEQTCKDGSTVWTEVILTFLRDSDGQPIDILGVTRDITARKRAEEALRESEARFRTLSEATFEAIAVHEKGEIVDANRTYAELFGYEPSEIIGMHALDFAAPESRDLVWQSILSGRGEPFEAIGLRKDGSTFLGEIRGKAIPYQGRMVTVTAIRDVTERKRAGEALRDSEQRFRTLSEATFEGIAIHKKGRILDANQTLAEMFGYQLSEVVGMRPVDFVAPESRDLVLYATRSRYEKPFELIGFRKDGSTFPIEACGKATRYQNQTVGVAAVRDISERKQAEEALRESEEKFRNIFQSASDAIIYLDTSGIILDVNNKAVELFGGPREELLGRHFTTVGVFHPGDMPTLMSNFARILAGEKASVEVRIKNREGQERFLDCSGSSLNRDGEAPPVLVVIARDISERKRAEEALRAVREDIESRVERRMQQVDGYALTFRELAVLHLVAGGESDKEIAAVLGISPLTVHKHLANILEKMGAVSRTEAGVRALREGLLD